MNRPPVESANFVIPITTSDGKTIRVVPYETSMRFEQERNEVQEKYDTLAVENMLEVNKICNQRDEAVGVLSYLSHYLSCGLGDENTTAKEYGARIQEGINALLDPILEEKNKLAKELKEAWLAMDEIEGTDRINEWQNKNANIFNTDT
jgi:hypothetical protein